MSNEIEKSGLEKADEFWKDMEVVEHSVGSFTTKSGAIIGTSSTTFKKNTPLIEDADFEVVQPKQIDNGKL